MSYFYHGVPEQLEGNELVPLNTMFTRSPDLYQEYLKKYEGREEILERRIPLLDCLWNDVVQLLPLYPKKLFEAQLQLGLIDAIPDYSYFQLKPEQLDPEKTVVYFKTAPGEQHVSIKWLKDVDLDSLQTVPDATRNYYENMVRTGEPVFNYQFVPHILYRGIIDLKGVPQICIKD